MCILIFFLQEAKGDKHILLFFTNTDMGLKANMRLELSSPKDTVKGWTWGTAFFIELNRKVI